LCGIAATMMTHGETDSGSSTHQNEMPVPQG
jgi:hypothetical protein